MSSEIAICDLKLFISLFLGEIKKEKEKKNSDVQV